MKKRIFLLFLLIPFSGFSVSSDEILREKIKKVVSNLITAKQQLPNSYSKKNIAILGFENQTAETKQQKLGEILAELLTEQIIEESYYFKVVERKELPKIYEELKLSGSDLFDETKSVAAGKLSGAELLIMGRLYDSPEGELFLNVKLVVVETGQIAMSKNYPLAKPIMSNVVASYQVDQFGQMYQTSFDLNQNFFIGGMWAPYVGPNKKFIDKPMMVDFGIHTFYYNYDNTSLRRFKILDGYVAVNPWNIDVLLFQYDYSKVNLYPSLWITTFFGEPARHDFYPKLGWGFKTGRFIYHPLGSEKYSDLETYSMYFSYYLWQSSDLRNYFRIRGGAGHKMILKSDEKDHQIFMRGGMGASFALDKKGIHNIELDGEISYPYYFKNKDREKDASGEAGLSYSYIFMAINDQPVSLFLKSKAIYRTDIADRTRDYELRFLAGLHFSFGVPPLTPVLNAKEVKKYASGLDFN